MQKMFASFFEIYMVWSIFVKNNLICKVKSITLV